MNDTSQIIKSITDILYSPNAVNQSKLLIVSKYTERTRVNLILLKYFLQEMNMRGLFITVDRPHQYIRYLLKLHGIPQKKLLFIDAVSKISGSSSAPGETNVRFMDGPYEVSFLEEIMCGGYETGDIPTNYVNLKELDFILIDDIAAFAKYMDEGESKELVLSYMASIKRLGNVVAPVVLDINRNKQLYRILKNECERIIFINLMKSLVKDINMQGGHRKLKTNFRAPRKIDISNIISSGV